MTRIRKLLVANRGEIARRIIRTARAMGIDTVAVFSDADGAWPFVRDADEAVRLGPAPATDSYLRIDRLVDAARQTGCDAVHPGYGFLAENADFGQACEDAGLTFVGPSPEVIRTMGSKQRAKRLAQDAGVPVIPGYDGASQDPQILAEEARRIGFPVRIKASAGGGGKGMRVVHGDAELQSAIASARREAEATFGDGTLLLEQSIEAPRHVEIQILGDAHGGLIHLGERECSIQRRDQKIVEETPSPALDAELRKAMGDAAVALGRAIGYQSAGTVELILAPDGQFFFLEVNTRLQVEHPVTEEVTGLDLVREQIRLAEGEPLDRSQGDVSFDGAAIECRLYAEDPAQAFLPQSGRLADWHLPPMDGLREDGGVERGTEVGIHYDPMLAKIVTWAPARDDALRKMDRALRTLSVCGLTTNRAFLRRVLGHPEFAAGRYDTHFIARHEAALREEAPDADTLEAATAAAMLAGHERRREANIILPDIPSGWRNNPAYRQSITYDGPSGEVQVRYRHHGRGRFAVTLGEREAELLRERWHPITDAIAELTFELDGVRHHARVVQDDLRWHAQTLRGHLILDEQPRFPAPTADVAPGACIAPTPGRIVTVHVHEGDRVAEGDPLIGLEAMKMEHTISAPMDGLVSTLHVHEGDQVDASQILAVVTDS